MRNVTVREVHASACASGDSVPRGVGTRHRGPHTRLMFCRSVDVSGFNSMFHPVHVVDLIFLRSGICSDDNARFTRLRLIVS